MDEQQILSRLKAQVARHQSTSPDEQPRVEASGVDLSRIDRLTAEVWASREAVGQLNPRGPGLLNPLAQTLKRVIQRSLSWYTRSLQALHYNIAVALQGHDSAIKSIRQSLSQMEEQICRLPNCTPAIERLEQEFQDGAVALQKHRNAIKSIEESVRKLDDRMEQSITAEESVRKLDDRMEQSITAGLNRERASYEEKLKHELAPLAQRISGNAGEVESLRSELIQLKNEMRETRVQIRVRDRDSRRFFHDLQLSKVVSSEQPSRSPTPPMFPSGIKGDSEFDYFLFEETYRGDEALITARQKEYLEYFRGRENVIDIGCGRGEFIELLRDTGISARGVELGTDQYLLCRDKGLDVVQQDLFTYLESLPDESVGGLFSAQVIEHLAASDQLRFVSLAYRKTRPGSPVVFETINAECVFAVMRNFFLDPTHVRPVHPETLKFAMESVKFKNVELRFSSPMLERRIPPLKLNGDTPQLADFNRALADLNELVYGYTDYAAIGWR